MARAGMTAAADRAERDRLRRELAADERRRERERMAKLRERVKEARRQRRERLREIATHCRAHRAEITARAKERRQQLRDEIRAEREAARSACSMRRDEAHAELDPAIESAARDLHHEKIDRKREAIWTRKKPPTKREIERRRLEEAHEESDQVRAHEVPPELWPVWDRVSHRIKATARKTRAEAFAEWLEEHPNEVWEILHETDAHAIAKMERQLRASAKNAARSRRARDSAPSYDASEFQD